MPNWCEGTLRVRGRIKDLKRFILEGLEPVTYFGDTKGSLHFDEFDVCESDYDCYIKGTYRGFVENLNVYLDSDYPQDNVETIALETRFAWGITAGDLREICSKYGVDMRIFAFEKGMQFNLDIEIIAGKITKDEEIKFDDYEWDCICPRLGG